MQEEKEIVEQEGRKKEKFSYSKLSTYIQCPYRFMKRYDESKYSNTQSLATELGSICHKGLEIVGQHLINGEPVIYGAVADVVVNGFHGEAKDGKKKEDLPGVSELKYKYFEEWHSPDSNGLTYDEKMQLYWQYVQRFVDECGADNPNREWKVVATEWGFRIPISEEQDLDGFIDRIDQNVKTGELRIIDYKTSKKVFSKPDIATPLQMVTYAKAVEKLWGQLPSQYQFEFVLINQTQPVVSKGFVKRGSKKLAQVLDEIHVCRENGTYQPHPSPLCHWCDFCKTNPNAEERFKFECPYHSLWTPHAKTYEVNQPFVTETQQGSDFWF